MNQCPNVTMSRFDTHLLRRSPFKDPPLNLLQIGPVLIQVRVSFSVVISCYKLLLEDEKALI